MRKVSELLEPFPDFHEILGFNPPDSLFFDIETTGLSSASSSVFLIGTIHLAPSGESWVLTQYFAEEPDEEMALLSQFLEDAKSFSVWIQFNGSTFDLPFLKARAALHHLPMERFPAVDSIDLYRCFAPLKKLLGLAHMNQPSLEAFAGWQREDTLDGRQMTAMLAAFRKTRDDTLLHLMLHHNRDDLAGMTKILCLAAYLPFFAGRFASATFSRPSPESPVLIRFSLTLPLPHPFEALIPVSTADGADAVRKTDAATGNTNTDRKKDSNAGGTTADQRTGSDAGGTTADQRTGSDAGGTTADQRTGSDAGGTNPVRKDPAPAAQLQVTGTGGTLWLPQIAGEMKYFFPDYRNYFYLPLEDQAIHRSAASGVGKEYRTPARPDTCYVRRAGTFLWQPQKLVSPALRRSFSDRELFFEWSDSLLLCTDIAAGLARSALSRITPSGLRKTFPTLFLPDR